MIPGFLDVASCSKWVKRLERQPRLRCTMTDRSGAMVNGQPKMVEDDARVCYSVNPGPLRPRIHAKIREGFELAAQRAGRQVAWFEDPSILRYQSGGFYARHSDSCMRDERTGQWFKINDRDMSLLLYLNEDFTGGGVTFIHFNYHFRPKVGDLLMFPADNRYEHQAERVESGIRYAIATWAAFTGSPRILAAAPAGAILMA